MVSILAIKRLKKITVKDTRKGVNVKIVRRLGRNVV
jgi:hypothetical protein